MTTTATRTPGRTASAAIRLATATVGALVLNALVALAGSALDTGIGEGLQAAAYIPATLIGMVIGTVGFLVVKRFAPRALPAVVGVVLALSFVPNLMLLGQGATVVNVVALMAMHVVVAGAVVGALARR